MVWDWSCYNENIIKNHCMIIIGVAQWTHTEIVGFLFCPNELGNIIYYHIPKNNILKITLSMSVQGPGIICSSKQGQPYYLTQEQDIVICNKSPREYMVNYAT